VSAPAPDRLRSAYGPGPEQFGDLYRGSEPDSWRTVVVIHGGFWRPRRTLEMTAPLAEALAGRGWNVWNVEYRRAGQGPWPATLDDCAAAVDRLAALGRELSLDLGTALVLGHSAGGQLAVWAGGREDSAVGIRGVLSVAGVLDLCRAARARIGDNAVCDFVGGVPEELPERYEQADPTRRLPTGVAVRCVHSPADERVPFAQSARFVDAARRAGDDAELIEVSGVHVDGIDVRTRAGQRVVSVLEGMAA
jgi:acetyl esterase/lipase